LAGVSVPGNVTGLSSFLVGSDFQLITANIHTAPPARTFFARVEKVDDARIALAKARGISFGEKIGSSVDDRSPEIRGSKRLEQRFDHNFSVSLM
jgi:hypothetical protein